LEVERAVVDRLLDLQDQARVEERYEVRRRIQGAVDRLADSVADGQRLEERHDEVRSGPDPVEAERLSEVFATLLDAFDLRDVEEAADPDRAVEHETAEFAHSAVELALEEAVQHPRQELRIVEDVGDHHLN